MAHDLLWLPQPVVALVTLMRLRALQLPMDSRSGILGLSLALFLRYSFILRPGARRGPGG